MKIVNTFQLNGKTLRIVQSKTDDSEFFIHPKDNCFQYVRVMGEEASPANFGKSLEDMVNFIEEGIETFSKEDLVELCGIAETEWADLFESILEDNGNDVFPPDENIKDEAIVRLYLLIENAKWNAAMR